MSNTPSDEELDALRQADNGALNFVTLRQFRTIARAVLAKWGTPQPVVRESSEDLYWELHGLSKILEGSGLIDESRNPDAYTTILDAMAFVRGAQPVAREPLTDEQIRAMCKESWVFETVKQWVRIVEQLHGIKGGQHA